MNANKSIFRFLGTALLTVLSLGTVSCEKEVPVTPAPVLKLSKTQVGSGKGSQFIEVQATGSWTLSSEASWVRFTPASGSGDNAAVSLSYEANPDDKARSASITLSCGDRKAVATLRQNAPSEDPQPEVDGGSSTKRRWMELPETRDDDGLYFYTHDMTVGSKTLRNYSFYWDEKALVAHWVAYPLNTALRGSGNRSEAWGLDPLLPASKQPTVTSTFRGGWTRGHQIPSADRLNRAANEATFYGTNMTPQEYNFNGEIWARLEGTVRGWASRCDTLYVVTGCVVKGSTETARDVDGKTIKVPVSYYKAVLAYSKSNAANGGYRGCAVLLNHDKALAGQTVTKTHPSVMSVRALEEKLGINLFVNLPEAVGASAAEAIETENPAGVSWWW
ncbi:MAG: DNA/RNA non-specific endonuclease [Bacteroidales bacterium]|nr:DNA/RNA non-specific endonuclease [Bacteroidales bacterium]